MVKAKFAVNKKGAAVIPGRVLIAIIIAVIIIIIFSLKLFGGGVFPKPRL